MLEVEDEPEERDAFNSLHEHARREELARRNSLYLPHLRSAYPLEVFSTDSDTSRSSLAPKDGPRSSVDGGRTKDGFGSSAFNGHFQQVSRSDVAEGQSKDTSRSSLAPKVGSRSSIAGGRTKEAYGSSALEGHFKQISRSDAAESQSKDSLKVNFMVTGMSDI